MRRRRPILVLEVEPAARSALTSIPLADTLRSEAGGPSSTVQTALYAQACALTAEGRTVKAARVMLAYLVQAAALVPAPELKKQTSETLTIIETSAVAAIKAQKPLQAGKLIRVLEAGLKSGLITAQRRWHQIRILHLHAYYDLAADKQPLALKNLEKAQALERESVPVLARVTSRLLEAYLRSLWQDRKAAVSLLREALSVLQGSTETSKRQYQDSEWLYRVHTVLVYNLAVESCALYLRSAAVHYISQADQLITHHAVCDFSIQQRVSALKTELKVAETHSNLHCSSLVPGTFPSEQEAARGRSWRAADSGEQRRYGSVQPARGRKL